MHADLQYEDTPRLAYCMCFPCCQGAVDASSYNGSLTVRTCSCADDATCASRAVSTLHTVTEAMPADHCLTYEWTLQPSTISTSQTDTQP